MDAETRRQNLANIHQSKCALFSIECIAIAEAVAANDSDAIGETLGYTRHSITTLARVDELIPEALRDPLTPIDVYRACIEAHGLNGRSAAEWLERARANEWRAHHIRAAADLADTRNRRQPWASGGGDLLHAEGRTVTLGLDDAPSGEQPRRVKVRIMPESI